MAASGARRTVEMSIDIGGTSGRFDVLWWHGGGAWAWLLMTVGMVAFWGVVLWAVVTVANGQRQAQSPEDPASTLARRLANGEIDEDEYRRLLSVLRDVPVKG